MSSISKIINVILFIAYSILCVWIGYHFSNNKTVLTAPSTVVFRGVPDSVKPAFKLASKLTGKPDNVKTDTSQLQVFYQLDTVYPAPIQKPAKQYASYKTFSDSLGDYAIKVLSKSPVDSVFLTIHHFSMKTVESSSTDWKWYAAIGAAAVLIVEFIGAKIFK
jgi:hypothetical protein